MRILKIFIGILSLAVISSFAAHVPEAISTDVSHFEQLDDYSLLDIFDYLDIIDLPRLGATNARFGDLILNHYFLKKYQLNERPIIIEFDSTEVRYLVFVNPERQYINLTKTDEDTRWVLQHFGHLVSNLQYNVLKFGSPKSQTIYEYAEKYCPQVNKKITIRSAYSGGMKHWTHSFDNTATIVEIYTFITDPFSIGKIFPYVEELRMGDVISQGLQHHPHLTKCWVDSASREGIDVFEFIRLNPQIRDFHTFTQKNSSFVKYVNENLQNLQTLTITVVNELLLVPEVVRFKNVREFTLDLSKSNLDPQSKHSIRNLQFEQLEKLKIMCGFVGFHANLREMVLKNTGLKQLETNLPMTNDQLTKLTEALPALEEFSFYVNRLTDAEMFNWMRRLMNPDTKLNSINIYRCHGTYVHEFEGITPPNWQVIPIESVYSNFAFIRKH